MRCFIPPLGNISKAIDRIDDVLFFWPTEHSLYVEYEYDDVCLSRLFALISGPTVTGG